MTLTLKRSIYKLMSTNKSDTFGLAEQVLQNKIKQVTHYYEYR